MTLEDEEKRSRYRARLKVVLELTSDGGHRQVAQSINLSKSGVCVLTSEPLSPGDIVNVKNLFSKPIDKLQTEAKVLWSEITNSGHIHGLEFIDQVESEANYLATLIKQSSPQRSIGTRFFLSAIKTSAVLTPILAFILSSTRPRSFGVFFSTFIAFLAIERIWETFFTSKEFKPLSLSDDWSLIAVSVYYVAVVIISTIEFFYSPRNLQIFRWIGISIFLISFLLRAWGMKWLGDQWGIHAVGSGKRAISTKHMILGGPYHYIRHPIYFGVILELISIPLIANSVYGLGFALFVNVPLQVLRARFEEKSSIDVFGREYVDYMNRTPPFIPTFWRRKNF